jgi:hypothetical protein
MFLDKQLAQDRTPALFTESNRFENDTHQIETTVDGHRVVKFTITSDGTKKAEWFTRLDKKGVHVAEKVKHFFSSKRFFATRKIEYTITLFLGQNFKTHERNITNIDKCARKLGFKKVTPEVMLLTCEMNATKLFSVTHVSSIVMYLGEDNANQPLIISSIENCLVREHVNKKNTMWLDTASFAFISDVQHL